MIVDTDPGQDLVDDHVRFHDDHTVESDIDQSHHVTDSLLAAVLYNFIDYYVSKISQNHFKEIIKIVIRPMNREDNDQEVEIEVGLLHREIEVEIIVDAVIQEAICAVDPGHEIHIDREATDLRQDMIAVEHQQDRRDIGLHQDTIDQDQEHP